MSLSSGVAAHSLSCALGCSKTVGGGAARVPVTIARAEQRPVPYELSGTGTVEPRQTASVQAQVTGILTRVAFHEGDDVAAGQLLFQIDPRRSRPRSTRPRRCSRAARGKQGVARPVPGGTRGSGSRSK